jgi:hypothetical protein
LGTSSFLFVAYLVPIWFESALASVGFPTFLRFGTIPYMDRTKEQKLVVLELKL